MRAGQVEQLVLLPNQDLVQVQFKDGKSSKVNIFPNDQEVLRTAEAHNVPLDVRNSQGEAAMTGLLVNGLLAVPSSRLLPRRVCRRRFVSRWICMVTTW